ncbi:MAG: hypothetical protein ACRCWY_09640 [Cellulosilyticaceae bacterium]
MKLLGLLMVLIGCSSAGYLLDLKYRLRLKELTAFIHSFEQLKGDIDYRLTPLPEACIHVASNSKHGTGHVFRHFGMALEERTGVHTEHIWRQVIKKEKHRYHLKEEDYDVLYEFGHLSGFLDKEMQKNQIELVLRDLKRLVTKGEEEKEKTTKLYTGMGILIGACLCILLI